MKAIVLTFDKYKSIAQHMIMCYEDLWPNNPFVYRIPYQSEEVRSEYKKKFGEKVELVKSPSGIIDTIMTLTDDLGERDWVYWCMDDRFLISANLNELQTIYSYILSTDSDAIDGIVFSSQSGDHTRKHIFCNKYDIKIQQNIKLKRRKDYLLCWYHQFIRVKVLRTFFGPMPRKMKQAKVMDEIRDKTKLSDDYKLYVLNHSAALYGESSTRGKMSRICADSFKKRGLLLPQEFEICDFYATKGHATIWGIRLARMKEWVKSVIKKNISI